MKKTIVMLTSLLGLTGCFTPPQIPQVLSKGFDEADYASYRSSGKSTLRGQVFALTVGGDVKVGAGSHVFLYPATDYGKKQLECWMREYVCRVTTSDEELHRKFMRIVQADGSGKFEFTKLPAGKYVVMSHLTWQVPSQYGVLHPTGGNAGATVEILDGEDKTVQLKI
jgi:hypothetical protein